MEKKKRRKLREGRRRRQVRDSMLREDKMDKIEERNERIKAGREGTK